MKLEGIFWPLAFGAMLGAPDTLQVYLELSHSLFWTSGTATICRIEFATLSDPTRDKVVYCFRKNEKSYEGRTSSVLVNGNKFKVSVSGLRATGRVVDSDDKKKLSWVGRSIPIYYRRDRPDQNTASIPLHWRHLFNFALFHACAAIFLWTLREGGGIEE